MEPLAPDAAAALEADVLAALSAAREDPRSVAARLKERSKHYQGKTYAGAARARQTKEGVAACKDAVSYFCRVNISPTSRGDAAAGDVDIPWQRVEAPPRLPRGHSVGTSRCDAAALRSRPACASGTSKAPRPPARP